MDKIIIKTNKVIQPIGEFYTGVINSKELLELSFVDYRTIKDGENFLGLQRLLDIKRQKDIKKYVRLLIIVTKVVLATPLVLPESLNQLSACIQ